MSSFFCVWETYILLSSTVASTSAQPITHDIGVANQWYNHYGMILKENKHQVMALGSTDCPLTFSMESSIDMFGMNVDKTLSFDEDIFQKY